MNENSTAKRSQNGLTLSTLIGITWIHALGASIGFYMIYFSTAFNNDIRLALGTFAFILAPMISVVPTDIMLKFKAWKLAKKYGAEFDGVSNRSKLGFNKNGKMVLFLTEDIKVFVAQQKKYIRGRIQVMPVTKECETLNASVQNHLEWTGLLVGLRYIFNIIFFLLNLLFIFTSSLQERMDISSTLTFAVTMSLWVVLTMTLRTFLLNVFTMKEQPVCFMGKNSFGNTHFAFYDKHQEEVVEKFLIQEGLTSEISGVMLDGSLLVSVKKGDKHIEYVLLNRL